MEGGGRGLSVCPRGGRNCSGVSLIEDPWEFRDGAFRGAYEGRGGVYFTWYWGRLGEAGIPSGFFSTLGLDAACGCRGDVVSVGKQIEVR